MLLLRSIFFNFRNLKKKFFHFKRKLSKYRHGLGAALCISGLVITIVIFLSLEYIVVEFNDYIHGDKYMKIDWHDWRLIDEEELRVGIGEHGKGEFLRLYPSYTKKINDTHGYNGYLSDKIALNRSLKDLRPKEYVNGFHQCINCVYLMQYYSISDVHMKNIRPI